MRHARAPKACACAGSSCGAAAHSCGRCSSCRRCSSCSRCRTGCWIDPAAGAPTSSGSDSGGSRSVEAGPVLGPLVHVVTGRGASVARSGRGSAHFGSVPAALAPAAWRERKPGAGKPGVGTGLRRDGSAAGAQMGADVCKGNRSIRGCRRQTVARTMRVGFRQCVRCGRRGDVGRCGCVDERAAKATAGGAGGRPSHARCASGVASACAAGDVGRC